MATITKANGKHVLILDEEEMDDLVYAMDCAALNASTLVAAQVSTKDSYRNPQARVKTLGRVIGDHYMKDF